MISTNRQIGQIGEEIATQFLLKKGEKILDRNFHGRYAEIDIICQKANKIRFVEVKTRLGLGKGKPHEAVDHRKIKSLERAIQYYLLKYPHKDCKLSLDLVSIVLKDDHSVESIKYFENINSF